MISVIIPALNEEKSLPFLIQSLQDEASLCEIIVVDGGSQDGTRAVLTRIPHQLPAILFKEAPKGRGRQMNAGAQISKGDILFFLHADCRIERGSLDEIEKVIQEGALGGCLTQSIKDPRVVFRWIEKSGERRAQRKKIFYGDQGIFVRKDIFNQLSGFREWDLFEDIDFSERLSKMGRTVVLSKKIYTDPRRWIGLGVVRTTWTNQVLLLLFRLGFHPNQLAKWYRHIR